MIISYSKKFISFRSSKTASSSLRVALIPHLSSQDRYTRGKLYEKKVDQTQYKDFHEQNTILPLSNIKIKSHSTIKYIKETADFKNTWDTFYKFTTVRNPYDLIISHIIWENFNVKNNSQTPISYPKKRWGLRGLVRLLFIYTPTFIQYLVDIILRNKLAKTRRRYSIYIYIIFIRYILVHNIYKRVTFPWGFMASFAEFGYILVHNIYKRVTSYKYRNQILDPINFLTGTALYKNKPILDFYLRYENLEQDYKTLCQKINIPYKPLPKLKTKPRQNVKHIHYSKYYTPITRYMVQYMFRHYIKAFGYKFEKIKNTNSKL